MSAVFLHSIFLPISTHFFKKFHHQDDGNHGSTNLMTVMCTLQYAIVASVFSSTIVLFFLHVSYFGVLDHSLIGFLLYSLIALTANFLFLVKERSFTVPYILNIFKMFCFCHCYAQNSTTHSVMVEPTSGPMVSDSLVPVADGLFILPIGASMETSPSISVNDGLSNGPLIGEVYQNYSEVYLGPMFAPPWRRIETPGNPDPGCSRDPGIRRVSREQVQPSSDRPDIIYVKPYIP